MKQWNHAWSFLTGAGAGGTLFVRHGWALLLAGFLLGALAVYSLALARRLLRRIDRALPDAAREIPKDPNCLACQEGHGRHSIDCRIRNALDGTPLSEDADYLDGARRGIAAARRSAGHEDGRLAELDRLQGRGFA